MTSLTISPAEIQKAQNNPNRTLEKVVDNMFIRLSVFVSPAKNGHLLANISHKMQKQTGLNKKELKAAIQAGLITKDQTWFWTEKWQNGEKIADKEIASGKIRGPFRTAKDFLQSLKT